MRCTTTELRTSARPQRIRQRLGKVATHTYGAGGTYSETLTVADAGGSSTKTQPVRPNQPPTVNAGPDETVVVGLLLLADLVVQRPGQWAVVVHDELGRRDGTDERHCL